MSILYADNFLAGSVLTLLMPTILLSLIAVWYVRSVKSVPDTRASAPALPPDDVVAAAEAAEGDTGTPEAPSGA